MTYKLLLADDSVTIQKVVELTFSDEDFEIIAVGDGNSAYEKIKSLKPDIILSDVIMPGMNGYDLCARVKQDRELQKIPFLFLKGTFESFDEERAAAVNSNGFIVKPFESQELIAKVKELVAAYRAAPAAPAAPIPSAAPFPPAQAMPLDEFAGLGELGEEAPAAAGLESLESFPSEFEGIGEILQPAAASATESEEDLWSEVKISDHPIPPSPAAPAAEELTGREAPLEEQPFLEEVQPLDMTPAEAVEAPPQAAEAFEEEWPAVPPPYSRGPSVTPPQQAAPPAAAVPTPDLEKIVAARVEAVIREIAPAIIRDITRQVISDVVWEVVPETAESLIKKEIDRLTGRVAR